MERSTGAGARLRAYQQQHEHGPIEQDGTTTTTHERRTLPLQHLGRDGDVPPRGSTRGDRLRHATRGRLVGMTTLIAVVTAVGAIASAPHLVAIGSADGAATPSGDGAAGPVTVSRPVAEASGSSVAGPSNPVAELRATWRLTGGLEEAAALGVIVARRAAVEERGADTAHRAFAVLEAVERPTGDAIVVTVLVDVGTADDADGDPGGDATGLVRMAVPLVVGDQGPSLAGEPWVLPAPDLTVLAPAVTSLDDPRLVASARLALVRAGSPPDDAPTLERTSSWPVVARLTVDGRPRVVWLRWHLDRFVVAGLPLDRAVARPTSDAAVVR